MLYARHNDRPMVARQFYVPLADYERLRNLAQDNNLKPARLVRYAVLQLLRAAAADGVVVDGRLVKEKRAVPEGATVFERTVEEETVA